MRSKTELVFYLGLAIGIALLAGVAVYAVDAIPLVFQVEQDIVPRTISALPRVRKISGQKAIENIQQIYGYDFNLKNSAFATKEVAEELLKTGFSLGGKHVNGSAMFTDIRSFTTLAES